MASEFALSVLTPERTVLEGKAHHAALVTALAPGVLTVRHTGGREERMHVSGGFFDVSNNRATVLADAVSEEAGGKA